MSIFFDDEAQLSGTDSGDENDNDLLTSQDLLFIDDDDTQDCSPSFYRSLDLSLALLSLSLFLCTLADLQSRNQQAHLQRRNL